MIRRSLALVLIGAAAGSAAAAQTTAPSARGESRGFAYIFDGDNSYLGVETEEVTKENFGRYGLRDVRGVAVAKVIDGSPAQGAGLQAGDVIIKFNGDEATSVRKLTRLVADVAPDHAAKLTVLRNGDSREVTVTLGKRPAPKFEDGAFALDRSGRLTLPPGANFPDTPMPALPPMNGMPQIEGVPPMASGDNFFVFRGVGSGRQIGINISPLTKQLADHFGVTSGVLVNNVREASPADKAGLKAGDIITEIDGKEVKNDLELMRAVGEKKSGDVELTVIRDRNRQTIRVTPEEVKDRGFSTFDLPDLQTLAPGGKLIAPLQAPNAPAAPRALTFMMPGRVL